MNDYLDYIVSVLSKITLGFEPYEANVHLAVIRAFEDNKIDFIHEYPLYESARIDFLVSNIGIEVKNNYTNSRSVLRQLSKYAKSTHIDYLILLSTKKVNLPSSVNNKQLICINLSRNWSVAL